MSIFDSRPKFAVHVAQTDETFPCAGNESLLTGMVRLGRKGIPVGCVNGGCGVCKVAILSGEVQTRVMSRAHVSEADEQDGRLLACCVQPRSDIRLQVLGPMRKSVCR